MSKMSFIGFTGTPIGSGDKNAWTEFGGVLFVEMAVAP
jgi:type I site-specific restriction-modification system R (restriction) subunit